MKNQTEIVTPFFCGFYNSALSDMVDQEVEMEMEDKDKTYEELEESLDYRCAYLAITKQWLSRFNELTGFNIEFKEIDSPREYNFTTDKLVGTITFEELKKARQKALDNPDVFQRVLDMYFKSYDGFMSFYSDEPEDFHEKDIEDLDCNEAMAYVACSVLVDMEPEELQYDIITTPSVYEAANNVFKY